MDINRSNPRRRSRRSQSSSTSRPASVVASVGRKSSGTLAASARSGLSASPFGTPRTSFAGGRRPHLTPGGGNEPGGSEAASAYSVDINNPDPELVRAVGRHLVHDSDVEEALDDSGDLDERFSSLRLQGGDITRQIYNWEREHGGEDGVIKRGRSRSFDIPRPLETGPSGEPLDVQQIRAPGGFRRDYLTNQTTNPHATFVDGPAGAGPSSGYGSVADPESARGSFAQRQRPTVFTRNFIEFLSLYGHFAGEELEEDDEDDEDDYLDDIDEEDELGFDGSEPGASARRAARGAAIPSLTPGERSHLMPDAGSARPRARPKHVRRASLHSKGHASTTETVMLLLKSFVGTGVLFLPRAFYNGGLLFSTIVLVAVSLISYWCFLLLVEAKEFTKVSSFGDIGGALYGPSVRKQILSAIVLSQIGFASAYIVFVSENIQAFFKSVADGQVFTISTLICIQLIVFLPLSMIRDIAKLGFTALIADAFILLGLLYLYGWGGTTIIENGIADVAMFNKNDWTLFIGTAIFTFEGVGLIIPIQESMREPQKFGKALAGVMVGITVLFVSVGALLYMACGSAVETVILLNLPKNSRAVSTIQLLYSVAILLSTPLQLFPAIRVLENWIFVRSGKFSRKVKWEKNLFRFGLVFFAGVVAYVGSSDLDKFVALVGSFACVPLLYIYPPLLHKETVPRFSRKWYADILLVVFGACVMAYTSTTTLKSWIS